MDKPPLPVLLPFHQLMSKLRVSGFIFGVDTYVRVEEYWQHLVVGKQISTLEIKVQLGALLCRNEEQQQLFEHLFDAFLPPGLHSLSDWGKHTRSDPDRSDDSGEEEEKPEVSSGSEKKTTNSTTSKTVITGQLGQVLPLLHFPERRSRIWNLDSMNQAMSPLQEKIWTGSLEWDIRASIRAITRGGGYPRIIYKKQKQAPRYLALIEQQSSGDHLAGYAAELIKEIQHRDLEADYYFFDKNPARCWKVQRKMRTHVNIELLKSEWSGARLLLLSHASHFVNAENGMPSNLALDLHDDFPHVALLATNSPLEWDSAERSLSSLMPILPMSVGGLAKLMEIWNGTVTSRTTEWHLKLTESVPPRFPNGLRSRNLAEVYLDLYRYLGKAAFKWLCCCAVYPELYFELSSRLYHEVIVSTKDLSQWQRNAGWNQALSRLSRLDWFRRGYLPESLSEELKQYLSTAEMGRVEKELRLVLDYVKNQVGPNTPAAHIRRELFDWLKKESFRVLWIDDQLAEDEHLLASWSQSLGASVQVAADTSVAATLIDAEHFDFIISNSTQQAAVPTDNVLAIAGPEMPVLFFTDEEGLSRRDELLEAGAIAVTNSVGQLRQLLTDQWQKKFPMREDLLAPPLDQAVLDQELLKKLNLVLQGKTAEQRVDNAKEGNARRKSELPAKESSEEFDGRKSRQRKESSRATSPFSNEEAIRNNLKTLPPGELIDILVSIMKDDSSAIMQSGRWNSNERRMLDGIISEADFINERVKIISALEFMIDDLAPAEIEAASNLLQNDLIDSSAETNETPEKTRSRNPSLTAGKSMFSIGTRVRFRHSGDIGKVTGVLDNQMVKVYLIEEDMIIPAFIEDLERYKEQATSKTRFKTGISQQIQGDILKNKGIQLAFDPVLKADGSPFEYDMILINDTRAEWLYSFALSVRGELSERKNGRLSASSYQSLGVMLFDEINDAPIIDIDCWKFTNIGTGSKQHKTLKIKPKSFFNKQLTAPVLNRKVHLYLLFPANDSATDKDKKQEANLKPYLRSRRDIDYDNPYKEVVALSEFEPEIDLHIDRLVANPKKIKSDEILPTQLDHLERYLDQAIRLGMPRVFIIHGLGTGKLRSAVATRLLRMPEVKTFKNEFHTRYGYGATEVVFEDKE